MATFLCLFFLLVIALELYTGCAFVGWIGGYMIVKREKMPGVYWVAIAAHAYMGFVLPLLNGFV